MSIQDIIEGKKQWRAHLARVKALPPDYQIVYREMRRYLFKIGSVDQLSGIVDFFEEGAASGNSPAAIRSVQSAYICKARLRPT